MGDFMKQHSSQNTPCGEAMSTERLESMSPVELANTLEQILDSMTEESYDPALIDAYLNALDQKAPIPEEPNAEEAFREFQEKLRSASSAPKDEITYVPATKRRPYKRVIVTIAAAVALICMLIIGAQAAGFDVFGSLARWTDEIFYFLPSANKDIEVEYQAAFQQALETGGLPKELAPSWFPDGFQASDPQIWVDDAGSVVDLSFRHEDGRAFAVSIEYYADEHDILAATYQKDSDPVEEYVQNERKFYIMSNANSVSAVWTDGHLVETISGRLSVEEIKMIIDSIGG